MNWLENIELIAISFIASTGFALFFRIWGKDLVLAGLGGALTRAVYLILTAFISSRIIYMTLAAMFVALYGELLAVARKDPSTYFIYPSLIPLIPGDLFVYAVMGLVNGDMQAVGENGLDCLLTLLGISIGFVISSTVAHYIRKMMHIRKATR